MNSGARTSASAAWSRRLKTSIHRRETSLFCSTSVTFGPLAERSLRGDRRPSATVQRPAGSGHRSERLGGAARPRRSAPVLTLDAAGRNVERVAGCGHREATMVDDKRVRLIRPEDRAEGQLTPGMRREQAVTTDRSWAGYVTTEAGMESGPGGRDVVDAQPGDFVFVPPHTVHREGNPTSAEAAVIVVRAGSGEAVFNV